MKRPQQPPSNTKLFDELIPRVFSRLSDAQVRALIKSYNDRYLHWDEIRRRPVPSALSTPEEVWALVKLHRLQQYRAVDFGEETFNYILRDADLRELHLLDTGAAGNIQTELDAINTSGADRYIINSLMEEAIASSQIEGAATTRKIAKEMLRRNKKPTNRSEQMIVNGYRTIREIAKKRNEPLTAALLLELQQMITESTIETKDSGAFRDNNEIVVADPTDMDLVFHRPPDFTRVPQLIEELCSFANEDGDPFIHPIVKGIMLHFFIGYIHPFNDGNGRTARAVFYWYVLSRGYWLFEFMSLSRILLRSKKQYGLSYLYTETDDNDLTYFITFNLEAIQEAFDDMVRYIRRKQNEQAQALKLIEARDDLNVRQAQILRLLMKRSDSNLTIGQVQTMFNVVYETARTDLHTLADRGLLFKKRIGRKYVFSLNADQAARTLTES